MCRAKLSLAMTVVVVGHQWLSVTEESENGKNRNDCFRVAEVESCFLSPGKCSIHSFIMRISKASSQGDYSSSSSSSPSSSTSSSSNFPLFGEETSLLTQMQKGFTNGS